MILQHIHRAYNSGRRVLVGLGFALAVMTTLTGCATVPGALLVGAAAAGAIGYTVVSGETPVDTVVGYARDEDCNALRMGRGSDRYCRPIGALTPEEAAEIAEEKRVKEEKPYYCYRTLGGQVCFLTDDESREEVSLNAINAPDSVEHPIQPVVVAPDRYAAGRSPAGAASPDNGAVAAPANVAPRRELQRDPLEYRYPGQVISEQIQNPQSRVIYVPMDESLTTGSTPRGRLSGAAGRRSSANVAPILIGTGVPNGDGDSSGIPQAIRNQNPAYSEDRIGVLARVLSTEAPEGDSARIVDDPYSIEAVRPVRKDRLSDLSPTWSRFYSEPAAGATRYYNDPGNLSPSWLDRQNQRPGERIR